MTRTILHELVPKCTPQDQALAILQDTETLRGLLHRHGSARLLRWLRWLCFDEGLPYGPQGEAS